MSELRRRVTGDLQLRGLSARTQEAFPERASPAGTSPGFLNK